MHMFKMYALSKSLFVCTAVKCQNQLDCVWVVDDSGETVCSDAVAQYSLGIGACKCFDEARTDDVTGRCSVVAEQVVQPPAANSGTVQCITED